MYVQCTYVYIVFVLEIHVKFSLLWWRST